MLSWGSKKNEKTTLKIRVPCGDNISLGHPWNLGGVKISPPPLDWDKVKARPSKEEDLGETVVVSLDSHVVTPLIFALTYAPNDLCLVLLQVPKCFCAGPNFLSQPKNLTAFSASSKTFVLAQKKFYWMQIIFLSGTKCLWQPQYANKFLARHKKFGPAQNILGPVQ